MAVYRNINVTFWTDTKVSDDFTPEDKYFMLYCLTNNYTNLCGCYEISIKQISKDMGYDTETVEKLLKRFSEIHKVIFYNKQNKELLIKNWSKYNWTKSEKLDKPLLNEIENIKTLDFKRFVTDEYNKRDTVSIPYTYPMDTTVSVSVSDTVSESVINNKEIKIKKEDKSEEIKGIYNQYATNLPQVKILNDTRKKNINKLLKVFTEEQFKEICKIANTSDFLTGKNDRGWKADFDFLIRTDKAINILEGKFDNKTKENLNDNLKKWLEETKKKEGNWNE